jgi:asparagine synthetase B (glutamine-hydrolysing)
VSDGLSDAAADDLLKSIRGAFDFASKFIKKIDRDAGGVSPALVAKKEDAMFVYSNALTLVNLLAAKRNRADR